MRFQKITVFFTYLFFRNPFVQKILPLPKTSLWSRRCTWPLWFSTNYHYDLWLKNSKINSSQYRRESLSIVNNSALILGNIFKTFCITWLLFSSYLVSFIFDFEGSFWTPKSKTNTTLCDNKRTREKWPISIVFHVQLWKKKKCTVQTMTVNCNLEYLCRIFDFPHTSIKVLVTWNTWTKARGATHTRKHR